MKGCVGLYTTGDIVKGCQQSKKTCSLNELGPVCAIVVNWLSADILLWTFGLVVGTTEA